MQSAIYWEALDLASLRAQLHAAGQLILQVKVVPKSARTEFAGVMADGTVKVRVGAAPEKGKANAELCAFLARELGVSKTRVHVESGETSARKRIVVVR